FIFTFILMYKYVFIGLMLLGTLLQAQTRKPAPKGKVAAKPAQADTVKADSVQVTEETFAIPKEFAVDTRRSKTAKKGRVKLCLNLVSQDSTLNSCMNDSILHDPEVSKILFEAKEMDTTYTLVYVMAFSKSPEK